MSPSWLSSLPITSGTGTVDVIRTKHDASFFVGLADLFSAGAITRTLEEVLPRAVGGVGAGAFGNLGVFATDAVPEPHLFATMDVSGNIDIWPGGLGIPTDLVARSAASSFPPPVYLLGHTDSREFLTDAEGDRPAGQRRETLRHHR